MQCALQSSDSSLPVTALRTIYAGDLLLLLSGQGPFLKIHDFRTKRLLLCKRVFYSANVHGIACDTSAATDGSRILPHLVLLWGGTSTCSTRINFPDHLHEQESLSPELDISTEQNVGDWILDAALVSHSPISGLSACLLTAHNVLMRITWTWATSGTLHYFNLVQLSSGINSILYSAHVLSISSDHILIACGTIFGEVIIWSSYRNQAVTIHEEWAQSTHRVYIGHKGSIFGVHISDAVLVAGEDRPKRLLASCSDDRTIRIWDVPMLANSLESNAVPLSDSQLPLPEQRTGFGTTGVDSNNGHLALAWGHLSRIWGITFLNTFGNGACDSIQIISMGEDATCQLWDLPLRDLWHVQSRSRNSLKQVNIDRHHFGKSIWSTASVEFDGQQLVLTGGADGRIISRSVASTESMKRHSGMQIPFKTIADRLVISATSPHCGKKLKPDCIKQYGFVSNDTFVATTASGSLLQATICKSEDGGAELDHLLWKMVLAREDLKSYSVLTANSKLGIALVGNAAGHLWMYRHPDQSIILLTIIGSKISGLFVAGRRLSSNPALEEYCFIASFLSDSEARVIWIRSRDPSSNEAKSTIRSLSNLSLPPAFVLVSACLLLSDDILVLGSRAGAIAVYNLAQEEKTSHYPLICIRHVHGSDAVTLIKQIPQGFEVEGSDKFMLTTGRDGTFSVHKITFALREDAARHIGFETVHASSPPLGPFIEGAYFASPKATEGSQDLMLFGFRSKDFVVWNESRQTEVFSVECGGAHRSWAFTQDGVQDKDSHGLSFIWTKAGSLNLFSIKDANHRVIQDGGHGREIKALAISSMLHKSSRSESGACRIIATGAEDTTIRLYSLSTNSPSPKEAIAPTRNQISCVRTLKRHTTGLQHLAFSPCGTYLFSSAGCEEFYAWRIRRGVPNIEIGVVLEAALPRDSNDSDSDSDLRITHFDITRDEFPLAKGDQGADRFLISTVYSNSMIKIFRYVSGDPRNARRFEMICRRFYKTNSLTQVKMSLAQKHDTSADIFPHDLLTASTDGHIAVWPATGLQKLGENSKPACYFSKQVHQSSIKTLTTTTLGTAHILVVTGGDDNALGFSIVKGSDPGNANDSTRYHMGTILIPKAHSAAITAVCTISVHRTDDVATIDLVSTGNDQRIKLWRVSISTRELVNYGVLDSKAMEAAQVTMCAEMWTSVADVGAMETAPNSEENRPSAQRGGGAYRIIVAGIGIEVVQVDLAR